jgi:hypothetical protein
VHKKGRGYPLVFRVVVREDGIKNSFHTISVTKDTHWPGSSFNLKKLSFDKIGGSDLSTQGLLNLLNLSEIHPLYHFTHRRSLYPLP